MSDDPFEQQERYPAISWKNAKVGTVVAGRVIEAPKILQARNYDTGEPDFWPDGNKKTTVVIGLETADGEKRSLWCPNPSAIFAAIAEAQKATERIAEGGILKVKLTGEKPSEKDPKKYSPQKLFKAKYEPPDVFAQQQPEPEPQPEPDPPADDFGEEPPF